MTNLEVVQRMFQAVAAQDLSTLEGVLDENLAFTLPGNSPFAGRTVGRGNVLALLGKLNGELAISNSVHGLYEGSDGVVVHQTGAAPGYHDESFVLFTIDNGRITQAVEFLLDVAAFDRYVESAAVQIFVICCLVGDDRHPRSQRATSGRVGHRERLPDGAILLT